MRLRLGLVPQRNAFNQYCFHITLSKRNIVYDKFQTFKNTLRIFALRYYGCCRREDFNNDKNLVEYKENSGIL